MYPNLPIVKVFVDYYFLQNCNCASSWVSSSLDCSNKKKIETIYQSNYSEKILIASKHNAS